MTINSVKHRLIAISNLPDETAKIVKREWEERFSYLDAFWLDVKPNENSLDLARRLSEQMKSLDIAVTQGESFLTVLFLDMTGESKRDLLTMLIETPAVIGNTLGFSMPLIFEFGYMNEISFSDKEQLRNAARSVIEINSSKQNTRKQLCLVARPPLVSSDNDHSWKAVMVFLDLLRRLNTPQTAIPVAGAGNPNDDIGFLCYGEYNKDRMEKQQAEIEWLERALSDRGEDKLRERLNAYLLNFVKDNRGRFNIDPDVQPLHPDMVIDGTFAKLRRSRAERGKDGDYERARSVSRDALQATGEQLREKILASAAKSESESGKLLQELLKEAEIGINLESDRKLMEEILTPALTDSAFPVVPPLRYRTDGNNTEIREYLEQVVEHAIVEARIQLQKELLEAYRRCTQEELEDRQRQLSERREVARRIYNQMTSKADLIKALQGDAMLSERSFYPKLPGGDRFRAMLCRTAQDEQELKMAFAGLGEIYYRIDETHGSLRTIDTCPIKAIQLLLFDCTEDRLQDLIR